MKRLQFVQYKHVICCRYWLNCLAPKKNCKNLFWAYVCTRYRMNEFLAGDGTHSTNDSFCLNDGECGSNDHVSGATESYSSSQSNKRKIIIIIKSNDNMRRYDKRLRKTNRTISNSDWFRFFFCVGYDDTRMKRKKRPYVLAKHRACRYRIMYGRR